VLELGPPAKVNLTLEVGARRADGYHELRSVFLRIGLADRLRVAPAAAGEGDQLTLSGLRGSPVEGNLVLRAFELLRQTVEPRLPGLRADLHKQIPIGAGLGGGSSDGASALELAAESWGIGLSPGQRAELALALGSDVPFFAAGAPLALVEGRGERVTPLPAVEGGAGVLLALSADPLSTARIFARYDDIAAEIAPGPTDALAAALKVGLRGAALADWAGDLRGSNHLWPAAASLAPQLVERRNALQQATGRAWLMSGSGPTLFTLYPSLAEAVESGERLMSHRPPALRDVMLCAADLDDPQHAWREQWPTEP
jgi:4-diphosphocytidyl-2-C-methyl-D-erythritol kinase